MVLTERLRAPAWETVVLLLAAGTAILLRVRVSNGMCAGCEGGGGRGLSFTSEGRDLSRARRERWGEDASRVSWCCTRAVDGRLGSTSSAAESMGSDLPRTRRCVRWVAGVGSRGPYICAAKTLEEFRAGMVGLVRCLALAEDGAEKRRRVERKRSELCHTTSSPQERPVEKRAKDE